MRSTVDISPATLVRRTGGALPLAELLTPGASDPRLMPTSPPVASSGSAVVGSPPRMPRPMSFGPLGSAARSRRHPRHGCITSGCWTIRCSTFGCRRLPPDCDRHRMHRPRSTARRTVSACTIGRSSRTPSRGTFPPAMGWREAWPRCSAARASCRRWSPSSPPSIEERYRCRAWSRSADSCRRGLAANSTWLRPTATPGSRRSRACCSCGGTSGCERRSSWPAYVGSTCWSAIDSSSSSMAVHSTPARTSNATASRISSSRSAGTSSCGSPTGWSRPTGIVTHRAVQELVARGLHRWGRSAREGAGVQSRDAGDRALSSL